MAQILEIAGWRERKSALVQTAPALACPTCEAECPAVTIQADESTVYRCVGHGHRTLTWRIDVNGDMLHGAVGRRCY